MQRSWDPAASTAPSGDHCRQPMPREARRRRNTSRRLRSKICGRRRAEARKERKVVKTEGLASASAACASGTQGVLLQPSQPSPHQSGSLLESPVAAPDGDVGPVRAREGD